MLCALHQNIRRFMKSIIIACLVGAGWFWFSHYRMRRSITVTCASMKDIGTYLQEQIAAYLPHEVLCAFDLDNTLLRIDSPLVYQRKRYRSVYEKLRASYPKVTTAMLYRTLAPHVRLTEPDVLPLLQSLKCEKIGFTACETGVFNDGITVEQYRYEELKAKGITFENIFHEQSFTLNDCDPHEGQYPTYHKGILFSLPKLKGSTSKGAVLCAFLKKIRYTPKCIVLVDDRVINHYTVRKALRRHFPSVKFIGIWYTGAQTKSSVPFTEEEFRRDAEVLFEQAQTLYGAQKG